MHRRRVQGRSLIQWSDIDCCRSAVSRILLGASNCRSPYTTTICYTQLLNSPGKNSPFRAVRQQRQSAPARSLCKQINFTVFAIKNKAEVEIYLTIIIIVLGVDFFITVTNIVDIECFCNERATGKL